MKIAFSDPYWARAGQLLRERQLPPEKHVLLQENLATYLEHFEASGSPRWEGKLQRDLSQPYSDAEVLRHVDDLQDDLKTRLAELPIYPSQIYVTGSFVRGRLGNNSDLDTLFVFPERARELDLRSALREEAENRISPFAVYEDQQGILRSLLAMSGARLTIDPAGLNQPGALRNEYTRRLAERGIEVQGEQCRRSGPPGERREVSPAFEWLTGLAWKEGITHQEKWDKLQGPEWSSQVRRCGLQAAGYVTMLPGMTWVLDQFVDQD